MLKFFAKLFEGIFKEPDLPNTSISGSTPSSSQRYFEPRINRPVESTRALVQQSTTTPRHSGQYLTYQSTPSERSLRGTSTNYTPTTPKPNHLLGTVTGTCSIHDINKPPSFCNESRAATSSTRHSNQAYICPDPLNHTNHEIAIIASRDRRSTAASRPDTLNKKDVMVSRSRIAIPPPNNTYTNIMNQPSSIETPKPNMAKFIAHLIELVLKEKKLDEKSTGALLSGTPAELEAKGVAILDLMVTGKFQLFHSKYQ
jgi:hypothetical protein